MLLREGGDMPNRHMESILWKDPISDIFNHEHKISSKTTSLLGLQGNVIDIFPNEVNHSEQRSPM
jgi:hypothetical protein